jgi:ABC-type nitrate/sulfonate/bicarbonate transport system substrate-binding protein
MSVTRLRIGYIPLVDAAILIVAADYGFASAEDLELELVREVSWSNVRDKLNIGLFDAAHLLSPMAIASGLDIGHVRVPIVAPFNLGLNGNAVTVSPRLHAMLTEHADGDLVDPKVSARALAQVADFSAGARSAGRGGALPHDVRHSEDATAAWTVYEHPNRRFGSDHRAHYLYSHNG